CRTTQTNDFVGEGERRALQFAKAGSRFPILQRGVLLVGDSHAFADTLVRDYFIGRLAQDSCARDGEFTRDRIQLALVADRAAQPAILFKITRRVSHHSKDIGVTVLAEDLAGAFA